MTLFDAYVMVDWSANNTRKTGKDSIWIAEAEWRGPKLTLAAPLNPGTRSEAAGIVRQHLVENCAEGKRTLVAFDFPYGFPAGLGKALGVDGSAPPWRALWGEIRARLRDRQDNSSNRFEAAADLNLRLMRAQAAGPWWACPPGDGTPTLPECRPEFPFRTKSGDTLEEFRHTERALRKQGRKPHAAWKLYTAGSVGGQALLGIPRVAALRDDPELASVSRVWPFETGFTDKPAPAKGPWVVHAEMWPGVVEGQRLEPRAGMVRDCEQVRSMCRWAGRLDMEKKLGAVFGAPKGADTSALKACTEEEGWILGA